MSETTELIAQQILNGNINKRTWGDILYNVKVYGAKGDWNTVTSTGTDDTVAIQATIDYAISVGGKAIFFPHGTYKVTALTNLSSVVLFGDNASFSGISDTISQLGKPSSDIVYNVKDYGAKGDASTDDTVAFQNAINAAALVHGTVYAPVDDYKITQLNIPSGVKIKGERISSVGTRLFSTSNSPMIYATNAVHVEDILFMGSANPAFTLQDGIFLDNCSGHSIINCFFQDLYNGIHIKDSVFYANIERCQWYSAVNSYIYGEGTTAGGYQVTINHCLIPSKTPNATKYGFFFDNAGTVTIHDLEMSPTGCTDGGVVFSTNAPQSGIHQITHSRLEGSQTNGLQILGTAANPIKFVFVSNSYIYGSPAVKVDYARNIYFDNTYFTGGSYAMSPIHQGDNIQLSNCDFEVTDVVLRAEMTCTSISYHVSNCVYDGGSNFIYLPFLAAANIKRISVNGGNVGTNANPISLTTYDRAKVNINVPGYFKTHNYGSSVQSSTGGGSFTIPHGLADVPTYANVIAGSQDVATTKINRIDYDATNITVFMAAAAPVGTNNLRFIWEARI